MSNFLDHNYLYDLLIKAETQHIEDTPEEHPKECIWCGQLWRSSVCKSCNPSLAGTRTSSSSLADISADYLRQKLRETSFVSQIMPPKFFDISAVSSPTDSVAHLLKIKNDGLVRIEDEDEDEENEYMPLVFGQR